MHFGENQLSPRSFGISPLSTSPPLVLQHQWVRASTECHLRFTLLMDSSRGFGSHRGYLDALFRLGCPPAAQLCGWLTWATAMHSPDHSTKGTPSAHTAPLAAGKYEVSGSVSFPSRGAFHLSLTVLVPYRMRRVVCLGGWSPQLPTSLHVARGTQELPAVLRQLALLDSHPLWWCLPAPSGLACPLRIWKPYNPSRMVTHRLVWASARFARHYYGLLG